MELFGRVVSGCFSLVMVVVFLVGFAAFVEDRVRVHRFRRRFKGKHVLVCSTRHGWHDFIVNNVAPVLPEGSTVEWNRHFAVLRVLRMRGKLPLLMHVGRRIRGVSLNERLLPLRGNAKRDAETQRRVAEIVAAAQREIA